MVQGARKVGAAAVAASATEEPSKSLKTLANSLSTRAMDGHQKSRIIEALVAIPLDELKERTVRADKIIDAETQLGLLGDKNVCKRTLDLLRLQLTEEIYPEDETTRELVKRYIKDVLWGRRKGIIGWRLAIELHRGPDFRKPRFLKNTP